MNKSQDKRSVWFYVAFILLISSAFLTLIGIYKSGLVPKTSEPVATIAKTRDFKLQMLDHKMLGNSIECCGKKFSSSEEFIEYMQKDKSFTKYEKAELYAFCKKIKKSQTLDQLDKIRSLVNSSALHYKDRDSELLVNVYNNFISAYATPIGVILGFLAIVFVLKIEYERLNNERKHYKKQAKDNLSDLLSFSIDLMEDIDKKHVDFFYTSEELRREGICINFAKLIVVDVKNTSYTTKSEYLEFKNLFSINKHEILPALLSECHWWKFISRKKCFFVYLDKYVMKKTNNEENCLFEKNIYISSRFIKKLYLHFELEKIQQLLTIDDNSKKKLEHVYYRTLSKNFIEYKESKKKKVHTLNEEVKKIAPNIEEIIIKRDFDLNSTEHKDISEAYLKILDNIKNFENIVEGNDFILGKKKGYVISINEGDYNEGK
jgi:hypothetical protein